MNYVRVEGYGAYSKLHFADGKLEVVCKSLSRLQREEKLADLIRVHKSHFIDPTFVLGLVIRNMVLTRHGDLYGNYYLLLRDNSELPVSFQHQQMTKTQIVQMGLPITVLPKTVSSQIGRFLASLFNYFPQTYTVTTKTKKGAVVEVIGQNISA